jgi:hypothetical protein
MRRLIPIESLAHQGRSVFWMPEKRPPAAKREGKTRQNGRKRVNNPFSEGNEAGIRAIYEACLLAARLDVQRRRPFLK